MGFVVLIILEMFCTTTTIDDGGGDDDDDDDDDDDEDADDSTAEHSGAPQSNAHHSGSQWRDCTALQATNSKREAVDVVQGSSVPSFSNRQIKKGFTPTAHCDDNEISFLISRFRKNPVVSSPTKSIPLDT